MSEKQRNGKKEQKKRNKKQKNIVVIKRLHTCVEDSFDDDLKEFFL